MFLIAAVLVIESLQPLHTREVPRHEHAVVVFTYARDGQYEYLGTPRGLYRADRVATGTLEAIADRPVAALTADGDVLYASFGLHNQASASHHTLFRSLDHGTTFAAIDEGLRDCSLQPCGYLVPRRIETAPGRLFVEAAGNLLASGDGGATWNLLFGVPVDGKPAPQVCPVVFTRIGARVLMGGECPLDEGWVGEGMLRDDLLDWTSEPRRLDLPLENRNVHFFRHVGDGVVYAAPEGAILRSKDGGTTWRFALRYSLSDERAYPYIYQFLATPRIIVVGGFDKKDESGYLAYSNNGGATWFDVSFLVGNAHVELLAEDADGRLLIGLYEGETFTLAEIVLGEREGKSRAVRK